MTSEEHAQGYAICGCEKYAFVWKAAWLRWMPSDYHGELCQECGAWMCSVEKLRRAEDAKGCGDLPCRAGRNAEQQIRKTTRT